MITALAVSQVQFPGHALDSSQLPVTPAPTDPVVLNTTGTYTQCAHTISKVNPLKSQHLILDLILNDINTGTMGIIM